MLTDIFSSFDPATSSLYTTLPTPIFWASNFSILLLISASLWLHPSRLSQILAFPKSVMMEQVSRTFGANLKGLTSILSTVFIILISTNLTGLLPYVFSVSSHLFFTLALALPLWLALIFSSASFSITTFLAGILPGGAPDWLNPFLVLVETVSIMVRPLTLSFRLVANMSAGHIILTLISIYATAAIFSSFSSLIMLGLAQIMYVIFELAICMIQAYIFCLLLSLYSDDHAS